MSRLFLKVLNTPLLGTELTLDPPGGILGRSRTVEVSIRYVGLSGQHARFQWDETRGWLIADAGSTNGTWLNGEPLTETLRPLGTRARVSCADLELNVWAEPLVSPIRIESAPETMVYGVSLFKADAPEKVPQTSVQSPAIPVKQEVPVVRPSTLAGLALDLLDPDMPAPVTPPPPPTAAAVSSASPGPVPVSLMHEPLPVSLLKEPARPEPTRPGSVQPEPIRSESVRPEPTSTPKPLPPRSKSVPDTQELVLKPSELRFTVESAPETRVVTIPSTLPPPRMEPAPETRVVGVGSTVPPRMEPTRPDRVGMEPQPPRWESAPMPEGQALRALLREGRALADALGESLEVLAHGLSTGAHRERLEQTVEEASLRLADFRSRLNDSLGGPR